MRLARTMLLFLLILICGVSACNQHSVKLEQIEVLQIPLVFERSQISSACYQQKENLYLYHPDSSRFYLFNFNKKEVVDSFEAKYLKGRKIHYCRIDSLFYILYKDLRGFEIVDDTAGRSTFFVNDPGKVLSALYFPLHVSKTGLFLYNIPKLNIGVPEEREKYFASNIMALCKLGDSTIQVKEEFGAFPARYRSDLFNEYYPQAAIVNDSTLAYIFSIEPVLHFYEAKSNKTTQVKIDIPDNDLSPVEIDSLSSFTYLKRYELKNEKYFKLLYDPVTGIFFLFRSHVIGPGNKETMEMNTWKDKAFTMYMFGKDGVIIGRKEFNVIGDYTIQSFYANDHKLYLGKFNETRLTFEIYKY